MPLPYLPNQQVPESVKRALREAADYRVSASPEPRRLPPGKFGFFHGKLYLGQDGKPPLEFTPGGGGGGGQTSKDAALPGGIPSGDQHARLHALSNTADHSGVLADAQIPSGVMRDSEHTAIGDGAPHHAQAHAVSSHSDAAISSPANDEVFTYRTSDGKWINKAAGGGAPTDATYITQTANATLTNEQALSALATGLMKVTTATGVISSIATTIFHVDTTNTRIGVGTAAPASKIHARDTVAGVVEGLRIENYVNASDSISRVVLAGLGGNNDLAYIDGAREGAGLCGRLSFWVRANTTGYPVTEKMRIQHDGMVGVLGGIRIGSVTPPAAANYYAADGTAGGSFVITITDYYGAARTITIVNGLCTATT